MASFPLASIFSECSSIKLQPVLSTQLFTFSFLVSLMTLSPYPPVSLSISSIPPHSDGDIRTSLPTEGASRALSVCLPNHVKISLTINLFSGPDQRFRAGNRTESAPLASLAINLYFGHDSFQIEGSKGSTMESGRWYVECGFNHFLLPTVHSRGLTA